MNHKKLLIVGANAGIGLEMAKQLFVRGDDVTVTCRRPSDELLSLNVKVIDGVDVTEDSGIKKLTDSVAGEIFDSVICVAGLLESNSLDNLDFDSLRRQFEINAIAPLRVSQLLRSYIPAGGKLVILSSRMGSIGDNDSGGSYGYRMSKAAVNAAGKSLSIDLAEQGIAVGIFHPGWVRTAMTGFGGHLDPDECAALLIQRMDELTLENAGRFVHAEGEILPW